jgi:hypothetical protein
MEFGYDGKHGAYQPHIVRAPAVPPPSSPIAVAAGTSATAHDSPPTGAHAPLASRHAPSIAHESSRTATHQGKKQNILIKGIKTLISMCHSNDALIRESRQLMSQRLSHLEERQCEMSTSMGFETPPSPLSTLLFLLPLWKTLGFCTATLTTMMKMTMMKRSKRCLSEVTAFPSLFLVFDAKGEKKFYLFSYFLISSLCSSLGL